MWHLYFLFSDQQFCTADNKGNGFCDDANNHIGCDFDGGDCCGSCVNMEYCTKCLCLFEQTFSTGGQRYYGDGYCDDGLNKAECNFDGGDCCGDYTNTDFCNTCQCLSGNNETTATSSPETSTGTFFNTTEVHYGYF